LLSLQMWTDVAISPQVPTSPPVGWTPLSVKGGDRSLARSDERYRLLLQSGHGHWSQPHPAHAMRIMARSYKRADHAAAAASAGIRSRARKFNQSSKESSYAAGGGGSARGRRMGA